MSSTAIVVACAAVGCLTAFVGLVAMPAVSSYQRRWERIVAGALSLWVLGAFVLVGVVLGSWVALYLWPRLF
jgi:putative Mn2+ efflux pump MntP